MKSKPLTISIAVIILAIAIFLAISSNRDDNNEDGTTPDSHQTENGTGRHGKSPRPARSPHRTGTPASHIEWEEKIDFLLASDSISAEKATRSLLGITLDPKAPLTIRNDALEHALNLAEDEDFETVQSIMGTGDKELPGLLIQTILDDTLNRDDTIQLTTALKVIPGKHTAIVEEAIELLEFHLEMEFGNDIEKWNQAVATYIAEQKALDAEAGDEN